MKKAQAETQIRYLCSKWAAEKGIPTDGSVDPSFIEFYTWVSNGPYRDALDFRSRGGAIDEVSRWFDQEFKQTWKN
ncbi:MULTISPECIES: hypothetical protein [unclassified Rhizobium]|uniref:hypothetical protein n=1 Tax=unclassified Rhizobium TaxID=2613769 RepID=UPI000BD19D88|nr:MULTISPECIES: hypothetical protein [unclassified Rhizobium]MDH7805719.1 hypothetical protein [Rhizobium sp. AN67]MDQ4407193.1 hypothetical protein [Rhizobium sp. AN63]SOD59790.1 hypothetical protein SAMN05216595_4955 [Rhizobium sp. AN6A]